MFCRNCGVERIENAKFCRNCGSAFDEPIESIPETVAEPYLMFPENFSDSDKTTTKYKKKEGGLKYLFNDPESYDRNYVILSFLIPPFGFILGWLLDTNYQVKKHNQYGHSHMGGNCAWAGIFGLFVWAFIVIIFLNLTAS